MNNLLSKTLKSVVDNNIRHIKIKLAFFNNYQINSYFKHKFPQPTVMTSMVVYLFTCAKCFLMYIGSTKKMFSFKSH